MATGISKNKWGEDEIIISRELYKNTSENYSLSYNEKIESEKIISEKNIGEYKLVFKNNSPNMLFYGDNIDVLKYLLHVKQLRNSIKLVYIDPPYGTNNIFHSRENINTYSDTLKGSNYIEFLRRRLILLKELLSPDGSIYVHLDSNNVFQLKIIMDEIFGDNNFKSFITRKKCSNKNSTKKTYGNISDYILFYTKNHNYIWNRSLEPWSDDKIKKEYTNIDPITKRRYKKVPIHAPGIRNGETGKEWRGMLPPPGKHWQYTPQKLDEFDSKGEIYWSSNNNPRRKVFLDTNEGIPIQDIWLDVQDSLNQNIKITGYPTEKNPDLLKRIIEASSNEGDIVLDCFAGSGTTLGVASQLDRKWIGVDNSFEAINHIFKRFLLGTQKMGDYVNKSKDDSNVLTLFESLGDYKSKSSGLVFNFYIDNEYTLYADKLSKIWDIRIENSDNYPEAIKHLYESDKKLKDIINYVGECRLKPQKSCFLFLLEAIISQQLSLKASETIIRRLKEHFKNDITPRKIINTELNTLKTLGVSKRKASYLIDLSIKILNKEIQLEELDKLDNQQIIDTLTKVKGIGIWTSKMFLIFVLARPNVFPTEDTSFKNTIKKIYNLDEKEFNKKADLIKEKWHPYESIASWYIWAFQNEDINVKA